MTKRRIIGLVFFCLGIVLIILSINAMIEISNAKGFMKEASSLFSKNSSWNPLLSFASGKANAKIAGYDLPVLICLIVGIILGIAGFRIVFSGKHKK